VHYFFPLFQISLAAFCSAYPNTLRYYDSSYQYDQKDLDFRDHLAVVA